MYLQSHIYKNIPVSFNFITNWNQGLFLCSPCTLFFEQLSMSKIREICLPNREQRKVLKLYFFPYLRNIFLYYCQ